MITQAYPSFTHHHWIFNLCHIQHTSLSHIYSLTSLLNSLSLPCNNTARDTYSSVSRWLSNLYHNTIHTISPHLPVYTTSISPLFSIQLYLFPSSAIGLAQSGHPSLHDTFGFHVVRRVYIHEARRHGDDLKDRQDLLFVSPCQRRLYITL